MRPSATATVLEMDRALGVFPFGRPNTRRPMRRPNGRSMALVVGVYPSAFHVAWTPPLHADPRDDERRARPFIASLAVDVEPVVFWDGVSPSPQALLEQWRRDVGFDDERHGRVTIGNNGPSGAGLVRDVLEPLGIDAADAAFTDAVPWFFVKSGKGSQGEAMRERFNPVAVTLGVRQGSLPPRPSPSELVRLATRDGRKDSLRTEILEADAPLVITLGQEALDAVRGVADRCSGVQRRLTPDGYGAVGELTIDSRHMQFLPLVHPGFQRQSKRPEWVEAFARWAANARHG